MEMERGGGGHGGAEEENNDSNNVNKTMIINNIMLKYRPIAPKPVGGDGTTTVNSNKNSVVGLTKRKRKYVRVSNRRRTTVGTAGKDKAKKKEKDPATISAPDPSEQQGATSKTVAEVRSEINGSEPQKQLLFEFFPAEISAHQRSVDISDRKSLLFRDLSLSVPPDDGQIPTRVGTAVVAENIEARGSASSGGCGDVGGSAGGSASVISDLSVGNQARVEMIESKKKQQRQGKEVVVVQSWVTVERLTDACMDTDVGFAGIGSTDFERKKNLEQDMCPGFISDAANQVRWTNLAYRKMVIGSRINDHRQHQPHRWLHLSVEEEQQQQDEDDVVMVSLVEKERLPIMYPAFACLVRVQYYNNNHTISWTTMDQKKDNNNKCCLTTMTVPCDVWRMDRGGFAWRLDINAALTL